MRVLGYEVIEFHGTGDPFFGGSADDRPLGVSGRFLSGMYNVREIAMFPTLGEAAVAASKAPQRPGARLGFIAVRGE